MNQFGNLYSQYYDLLYSDKNYHAEIEYIDQLIRVYGKKQASALLDLGCGTGNHAELFCDKGYTVHGIDLSDDMLKIANTRRTGKEDRLIFSQSNITDLQLNKKFDVVVSLFHVMSYLNSNEDLIQAFKIAKQHLTTGGIFIFDFWYGPAVLTDLPTTRIKRLENNAIKVTRLAEPTLDAMKNIVDVHYDIFIEDKKTKEMTEKTELHKMRYLFDTELELLCSNADFEIVHKAVWMSDEKPNFSSWNVVWVLRN